MDTTKRQRHTRVMGRKATNAGKKQLKKMRRPIAAERGSVSSMVSRAFGDTDWMLSWIVQYYNSSGGFNGLATLLLMQTNQLSGQYTEERDPTEADSRKIRRDTKELRREHQRFREIVRWLCSAKQGERAVSREEQARLMEAGRYEWGRFPDVDSTTESRIQYLESHGLRHFKLRASLQDNTLLLFPRIQHIIDIPCSVLVAECNGRQPSEMPVRLCPKCGKLFHAESRKGADRKQFCSARCQRSNWWSREKRSDDEYIKRLMKHAERCVQGRDGYTLADLRARLERPRDRDRLIKIEERWGSDWPLIVRKVNTIKSTAKSDSSTAAPTEA